MAETIKGLNIKLGLDSSELNEKLKSLKNELKEQQADLKAINNALRYDSSNVDLWKQKQTKLNETLATTKERLNAQKQKLEEAKRALEVGAIGEAEFKKIERGVMYAEAEVNKLNDELSKTNTKITQLGNAKWDKLASVGSQLTKSLTMPIIGATTALAGLSYQALNTADEIGDTASKVYLSAEAYQEWAYVSEILAVDQNQLFKAFVKVNAMLGDIANGDIDQVNKKLALIGLTAEDFAGLSTEEAFVKLRDALAKCGDEATRTAIANEIFGDKLGSELTQVLSASSEQVNGLIKECRELGVISNEDAEVAGAFTDKISALKKAFQSLQFELAKVFLPTLDAIVTSVTNKVIPTLKNWINAWNELSEGTKTFIKVIGGVLVAVGPVLTIIGKLIPIIKAVKTAFTATSGAITIAGTAVKFSTLGWIALIAVIAVILLQNEKFRELLGKIMEILGQLLSKITDVISELINALMPVVEALLEVINEVLDILVDLIFKILDPIIELLNLLTDTILQLVPIIKQIVEAIVGILIPIIELLMVILEPILDIVSMIIDLIADLIGSITKLIQGVLGTLIEIIQVVADVISVVVKILTSLINLIIKILQPVLKIIMKLLEPVIKILEVVVEIISLIFDKLGPLIETLLKPLVAILEVVCFILEIFAPLLELICELLGTVLAPVLELIFAILEPFIRVLNAIIDLISWLFNLIFEGCGKSTESVEGFSSAFEFNLFDSVAVVTEVFQTFFGWLTEAFNSFISWIKDLGSAIGDFFTGVVETVSGWFNDAVDGISSWISDTWDGFTDWCSDTVDAIGNWFNDASESIGGWFKGVGKKVGGWFGDVGDWFSDTFNLGSSSSSTTTNNNNTSNTTNHVTINTTASEFDVDSINKALGGNYL